MARSSHVHTRVFVYIRQVWFYAIVCVVGKSKEVTPVVSNVSLFLGKNGSLLSICYLIPP